MEQVKNLLFHELKENFHYMGSFILDPHPIKV